MFTYIGRIKFSTVKKHTIESLNFMINTYSLSFKYIVRASFLQVRVLAVSNNNCEGEMYDHAGVHLQSLITHRNWFTKFLSALWQVKYRELFLKIYLYLFKCRLIMKYFSVCVVYKFNDLLKRVISVVHESLIYYYMIMNFLKHHVSQAKSYCNQSPNIKITWFY